MRRDAARALLSAFQQGREPDPLAAATVIAELRRFAQRAFPSVPADDVVQTTMFRMFRHARDVPELEIRDPWAYLVTACRFCALDLIRSEKRRNEVSLDSVAEQEQEADEIAALLDSQAARSQVIAVMKDLIDRGDEKRLKILTAWLDLSESGAKGVATREVAELAGVSHTTVALALKRFRQLLE
jgi:RNA polymerase sigma factor (sigma-70 family)